VIADTRGVIVLVNGQTERLFGFGRDELVGHTLEVLVPPRFREKHPGLRASYLESPVPRAMGSRVQLFGLRRDGTEVPIEISLSPLETDDGPLVSATIRDVSERLQFEASFESLYREAQEANRLKDEFLATVSHELRTPLNAMLGWARMLRAGEVSPAKMAYALEVIERNALAQAQLIEDLLDTARIVSGSLRLDVRAYAMQDVVGAAVDAVRPAMEAKAIRFDLEVDGALASLCGDPDRLQQVIWNLLLNATKFSSRGGSISLTLRGRGSEVVLAIADEGQGISPEFMPRLFERFAQADATIARREGGLGLGLALSRTLVELHGGTIEAESAGEGQGSTFRVVLPAAASSDRAPPPSPLVREPATLERPPELAALRVLVVEDEVDARELVVEILQRCGATAVGVSSATAALSALETSLPDVIVSDISMPGEDGYTFIRKVRERPPELGGKIPAGALTAFLGAEERRRAFAAGFQLHIGKPIDPGELVLAVANLARLGGR
jgi:PAS domain S-box-containing protein